MGRLTHDGLPDAADETRPGATARRLVMVVAQQLKIAIFPLPDLGEIGPRPR